MNVNSIFAVALHYGHPMSGDVLDADAIEKKLGEERRKVDVATLNFSVRELVRMMIDGEMNISPEYQRQFRWTEKNESAFIESIFLGLPVPPLYVATNADFEWEVVDGLQRLSTLIHYIAEPDEVLRLINRQSVLVLTDLEKLEVLNDHGYQDIPRPLQLYFGRQPLQVVSLTDKSDLQVRFDLFERLNGGSIALSPQEVRACVYRGDFNVFIEELAGQPKFEKLVKLQKSKQYDATRVEQVLKFFAYKNNRQSFDGRVTDFLNSYMKSATEGHFDYTNERALFVAAVDLLYEACNRDAYVRSDFAVTPLVQFEASLVAAAELLADKPAASPRVGWTDDEELKSASTGGTNSRPQLTRRIERARMLLRGDA